MAINTPKSSRVYLDEIDAVFLRLKRDRMSRFSVEWGQFSRAINLEIRKRIESKDSESARLRSVFVYWSIKSQILELNFKSRVLGFGKKKRLSRQADELRANILSDDFSKNIASESLLKLFDEITTAKANA